MPSYPANDPRTQTGGFVRDVRLVEVEDGDTTYTLMAFEVGGTLTLGAMTKGPFEGTAEWQLGAAGLVVRFAAEPRSGIVPVATRNAPAGTAELDGEKAGFRTFQWINVDVDSSRWLPTQPAALSLTFASRDGKRVRLPESGVYAAQTVAK